MNRHTRIFVFAAAIAAAAFLLGTFDVSAGTYSPCIVPPVVGQATRPNVMLIMDYSGSMQFPAYFADAFQNSYYASLVANCYDTSVSQAYDAAFEYYGSFQSDLYYKYDSANRYFYYDLTATGDVDWTQQPVQWYVGTEDSTDGGQGASIWFTTPGHNFQVGDVVALTGLSGQKSLNGKGFIVQAVSGDKFKINATWLKPDKEGYKAIKRITGDVSTGLSGNILNFAVTTRMDAALKALIGGKADCPSGDYCYLRNQGSRRYVNESTNLNASFYVRPASATSTDSYPNDYNTGTYLDKDIYVSIFGGYSGQTDTTDPIYYSKYFEQWTFTLTAKTRVIIQQTGTWISSTDYISIYSVPIGHNGNDNSNQIAAQSGSRPAEVSVELNPGTYYVRVTSSDNGLTPGYYGAYTLKSNVPLTPYKTAGFATHNGTTLTKIGTLPSARVRVKIPKSTRKGLVQETFPYVRFGLQYFKRVDVNDKVNVGKILVGCQNESLDTLINAFQAVGSDPATGVSFDGAFPYGGTPTGEALAELYDYFNQHSNADHAANPFFIPKGGGKAATLFDPFYSPDASGNPRPVPCRKSFGIIVSDGEWNGNTDPIDPARKIHTDDMRPDSTDPDLPGKQNLDIYSVYAFSQSDRGRNAMRGIAMYGSFVDVEETGCDKADFPFPDIGGGPGDSRDMIWPRAECNPGGTYNKPCCAEWDRVWDRNEDGIDEQKGVPDAYYEASNGRELEDSLRAVLAEVVARNASASAVATVSQELKSADIIVRGVFDAANPDRVDAYLWRGHLEAYFPFKRKVPDPADPTKFIEQEVYDFELPCNVDRICMDMPGTMGDCSSSRHCWDAGKVLSYTDVTAAVLPAARIMFTYLNGVQTPFVYGDISPTDLGYLNNTDTQYITAGQNLINWVRGEEVAGLRSRIVKDSGTTDPWRMGDIVYSTPVVVGPPKLGDVSRRDPRVSSYFSYRAVFQKRPKVVYVGANDGMLHAFLMGKYDDTAAPGTDPWIYRRTTDPDLPLGANTNTDTKIGKELWAYIPSNLLTELKAQADPTYGGSGCKHRYYVDLATRSWEVYIKSPYCPTLPTTEDPNCDTCADSNGRCWRTVIVGGERGGGDVYFAIDVTDPEVPHVLWEYSVLKNRVVVEQASSSTSTNCINQCKVDCQTKCDAEYTACENTNCIGLTNKTTPTLKECQGNCADSISASCLDPCETDCNAKCVSSTYQAFVPFRAAYESIKTLPMSWSQPYLARMKFPSSVKFYVGDPDSSGAPTEVHEFKDTDSDATGNVRDVAFMGGGIHIYDSNFDTSPPVDARFKLALFWPNVIMMDLESGRNLFEYVWPIAVNNYLSLFNISTVNAVGNTIPFAMSDPLGLDIWDQNTHQLGDDGFLDRLYVGDMRGYLYGIKFNLDPGYPDGASTNNNFGIAVDMWPTKPINEPAKAVTNWYRADRQPITSGIAATFVQNQSPPELRVIFGTGKYDDVYYSGDDKTDEVKMALYNLAEHAEAGNAWIPSVAGGFQTYDSSHATNFKVLIRPRCGSTNFNTGCVWTKDNGEPDCCETSCTTAACFKCIFDLFHPESPDVGPGERIIGKPLIAGGVVFVTSYVPPSDPCGYTGASYLYALDYRCLPFPDQASLPLSVTGLAVRTFETTGVAGGGVYGQGVYLGPGISSKAVIDSKGENVIVQMSDGTLKRLPVKLPSRPLQLKGWMER